jgi:hypothetical protein
MHLGEVQMSGQWSKLDEETCTKAGGDKAAAEKAPAKK